MVLTCPDKAVKSVHTVFAREGRAADPVRYHATCQHQGRSFASLTITAHQAHAVLASSSVSMHAVEDGPENQDCEVISAVLTTRVLAHARCFGRGDVLTEDGTLVASYAQEALLRLRDGAE